MDGLPFVKMHGLGNDFVVIDGRAGVPGLADDAVRAIADRHTGVGCDQLIVLGPPPNGAADVYMHIYNADGGRSDACGNATRCIGAMLMAEGGRDAIAIQTGAGVLDVRSAGAGRVSVDMGPVATGWQDIPLAEETDTLHLNIEAGPLCDPVAVNVGNPHMVFFVDDPDAIPLEFLGPELERHPLYPERANVQVATVVSRNHVRLRTWERGAGITLASGSGACATLVAAVRRELTERNADIEMKGGTLTIHWRDDGHVVQTGPASVSFTGVIDPSLLG